MNCKFQEYIQLLETATEVYKCQFRQRKCQINVLLVTGYCVLSKIAPVFVGTMYMATVRLSDYTNIDEVKVERMYNHVLFC